MLSGKLLAATSGVQSGSISYTSPGTYSWTAPLGVTSIQLQGRGGSGGTVSSWQNVGQSYTMFYAPTGGTSTKLSVFVGSSLTYETIGSKLSQYASSLNSITTSSAGADYSNIEFRSLYYLWSGDLNWYSLSPTLTGKLRRTGTFSSPGAPGSGTINPPTSFVYTYLTGGTVERFTTNYVSGGNSTAFGYTFPADGAVQTIGTVTGIVPNQTYTIVVGTNQGSAVSFVSFSWGN